MGDPEIYRNAELNLADCYLALGQLDDAQLLLETVERESKTRIGWGEVWMKWRYTQHLNASLSELWLARADPGKAIDYADACLTAAESTSSRRNIVKGRRLEGEAWLAQGKLEDAEIDLEEALRVAREVGNPAQLRLTLAALGRLRRAQGRDEDATAAYQEAIAVVERVAAGLSDPALRETLLESPQVLSLRAAVAPLQPPS
jgi:tetratricopeptide (TPR) repeat protein